MTTQIQNSKSLTASSQFAPHGKCVLKSGVALILGAVSLVATTVSSNALVMTFDLRAVQQGVLASDTGAGGTSSAWDVTDPHRPFIANSATAPGSKLVLQLFAVFNDATPGGDLFQFTQGSLVSSNATGDFLLAGAGTLRSAADGATSNNVPGLDASVSRSGNAVEASASYGFAGDGVMDIGDLASNNATTSAPVQWFTADSGPSSLAVGTTNQLLIGEFALTLGPNTRVGNIGFNYMLRPRATGAATLTRIQKFTIDATVYALTFQGSGTANGAAFSDANAFAFMPVGVPEPSAFGMVLLGSLGMIGFRRMGFRKA